MADQEQNRFSARAARYARVGANIGGIAARFAGSRLFGIDLDRDRNAAELAVALDVTTEQSLVDLTHVLLNVNEFVYIR